MIYNDVLKDVHTCGYMAARPSYKHSDYGVEYWIVSGNEHNIYVCELVIEDGKKKWDFRTKFYPSNADVLAKDWFIKDIEKDSFGLLPTDVTVSF